VRAVDLLRQRVDHLRARGVGESGELLEVLAHHVPVVGALERRAHEQGALRRRREVDQVASDGDVSE
jgi:hypothetical protein